MMQSTNQWAARPLQGVPMDKVNLSFFYALGTQLQPLTDMDASRNTRGQIIIASIGVRQSLENLFLTFGALRTCRQKGEDLQRAISAIGEKVSQQKVGDWQEVPESTDWEFRNVIGIAKQFALLLSEELQGLLAFHPKQTAILDTIALAERGEEVLLPEVRKKLDERVVHDVRESAKCLAFAVYTACGFHMMRAVESVLHQYWVLLCNPEPPVPERLENWGEYIARLRSGGDAEAQEVASMVQQIKGKRNNIMHPEMVLNLDESYAMFVLGQGAIMTMAKRLPTRDPLPPILGPSSGAYGGIFSQLAGRGVPVGPNDNGETSEGAAPE